MDKNFAKVGQIKDRLIQSLNEVISFDNCAFLNYPNYGNIGDHLIGLGTILYLIDEANTDISYVASLHNFSASEMEKKIGKSPILLQGGGNLGDLWYEHQKFREYIISNYHDNPIIILPQTIYFKNQGCLKEARKKFNSHPNLTIFVRDCYSLQIAQDNFPDCQLILAPDMAFQLSGMILRDSINVKRNQQNKSYLYFKRKDKELNPLFTPERLNLNNIHIEDWIAYKDKWLLEDVVEEYISREYKIELSSLTSLSVRSLVKIYREIWQRMLKTPREYIHRRKWLKSSPIRQRLESYYRSYMYQLSLSLSYSGSYQLSQYDLVITTRLHGHILCTLLGIPNIFLPNSYHKNLGFYEAWTADIPFSRFLKNEDRIETLIAELKTVSPRER
ncbi:MAG: polysaccharide pyruvyl transferase family protein [Cyanobacteria bacterium P01_E01_bin.42]